jgi:hypothetical protein
MDDNPYRAPEPLAEETTGEEDADWFRLVTSSVGVFCLVGVTIVLAVVVLSGITQSIVL